MDGAGALYGTTIGGGNSSSSGAGYGTVFKLTPPGPGQTKWTEKVLYRFAGGWDGQSPLSVLTADATEALSEGSGLSDDSAGLTPRSPPARREDGALPCSLKA